MFSADFLFQCSRTYMIHHTLRNTYQSSSTAAKTPAKINFLHVSKETPIQTSCLTIIFQADKKGSSTNPKTGITVSYCPPSFSTVSKSVRDKKDTHNGRYTPPQHPHIQKTPYCADSEVWVDKQPLQDELP